MTLTLMPQVPAESAVAPLSETAAEVRRKDFRFNRRRIRHAAFRSLLSIGLVTEPITYKILIQPEPAA